MDFWVRRNGPPTSGSDVFFGATGPNLQRTPTLLVRNAGTLLWEFNNITIQNTGTPINVGQWYHVAMTWDFTGGASDVAVWVDGVLVDSFTGVAEPTDFQASVLVGAYQDLGTVNQFANVSIDELDVFNRALTAAEIQSIFDAGAAGKLRTRFTVTSFNPSVVFSGTGAAEQAALNAAVGITGYTIEDFEDLTLIPGLTTAGGAFGLNIAGTFTGALWDGANYYVDQVLTGGGVTFNVAGGTSSFGIGLGDIDIASVNLFVNGEDLGAIRDLPNWVKLGDNVRDVYIRIDAAEGESITSVDIRQLTGTFSDGVFFDHLAIAP